jgi:hypothetical protein
MYALNLWPALKLYCDDGTIEIDNSAAERALRGAAIGRRNYLFAGADSGGERAAAMYSLIGTAKLNGIDPEAMAAPCPHPYRRSPREPGRGLPSLELRQTDRSSYYLKAVITRPPLGAYIRCSLLSCATQDGTRQALTVFASP